MTKQEKMFVLGLTDDDMNADPETLSVSLLLARFQIEFGGRFGYAHLSGDYGYFDGDSFRLIPENVTEEDVIALVRDSLNQGKNLFVELWTNIAKYRDNVDY